MNMNITKAKKLMNSAVWAILVLGMIGSAAWAEPLDSTDEGKTEKWGAAKKQALIAARVALEVQGELADYGIDSKELLKAAAKHPLSCRSVVPEHKRARTIILQPEDETKIGASVVEGLANEGQFYEDSKDEMRVRIIAERIVKVMPDPLPVKIHLLRDDSVNASCCIGGDIFVHRGLLRNVADDDLLAAVLAHEYAHAAARHSAEAITKMLMKDAVEIYATENIVSYRNEQGKSTNRGLVRATIGVGSNVGFTLPRSRVQEREADRLGMIFLQKAGYDPASMVRLFEWFRTLQGADDPNWLILFSTHPSTEERLDNARAVLSEFSKK